MSRGSEGRVDGVGGLCIMLRSDYITVCAGICGHTNKARHGVEGGRMGGWDSCSNFTFKLYGIMRWESYPNLNVSSYWRDYLNKVRIFC